MAEGKPLIEFVTYTSKLTSLEKRLRAEISRVNTKGDWMNDPATLENAYNCIYHAVDILVTNPPNRTHAYHNSIEIIKEEHLVYIQSRGVQTDEVKKICGWKTIGYEEPGTAKKGKAPERTGELTCNWGTTGKGAKGTIVKEWKDSYKRNQVKLYFGTNEGGQKLYGTFPEDILLIETVTK
jgi:hypothetical protein